MKSRRIIRSLMALTSARVAGLIVQLATSALFANRFGAGVETDAFFLARRIILGLNQATKAVISVLYVPQFVTVMHSGNETSIKQLWQRKVRQVGVISTLASIVIILGANTIISVLAPGFNEETQKLAILLLRIFSLLIPTGLAFALIVSFANSVRRFGVVEYMDLLPRTLLVGGLLFFVPPFQPDILAWIFVIGTALAVLLLIPLVRKALHQVTTATQIQTKSKQEESTQELTDNGRTLPIIAIHTYALIAIWIDLFIASTLASGSVSILEYSQRLVNLLPGVITSSLITILYTEWCHKLATKEDNGIHLELVRIWRNGLFFLMPLASCLWVCSELIVAIVLDHGNFDDSATTIQVMHYYAPATFITFTINLFLNQLLVDRKVPRRRLFLQIAALGIASRVAIVIALITPLGIIAIPLTDLLSRSLVIAYLFYQLNQHWGRFLSLRDIGDILLATLPAAASFGVMFMILELTRSSSEQSISTQLTLIALIAAGGITTHLLFAKLFGNRELKECLSVIRNKQKNTTDS